VLNNIIGQGEYLTSVVQMCRVAAAVANGGYLVKPHLIKEIEGEATGVYPRKRIKQLKSSTLAFMRRTMRGVVHGDGGTGRASRVAGLKSAGKTGTSQNPHGDDHAWFIGFAPFDEPEIAVAVVVENAGHGGAVAAPVVGKFYREYFGLGENHAASAPPAVAGGAPANETPTGGEVR
jgi:cell division protein FtsI/penicillin-binding protein 2